MTGTTMSVSRPEVTPPITAWPMGGMLAAFAETQRERDHAEDHRQVVIRIGRRRMRPAARTACLRGAPPRLS